MSQPGSESGILYKVKLSSGRILGPLDLSRVKLFIAKGLITGVEQAREHPNGDWKDINQFASLAELLVAKASGNLTGVVETPQSYVAKSSDPAATMILAGVASASKAIDVNQLLPEGTNVAQSNTISTSIGQIEKSAEVQDEDKTFVGQIDSSSSSPSISKTSLGDDNEATRLELPTLGKSETSNSSSPSEQVQTDNDSEIKMDLGNDHSKTPIESKHPFSNSGPASGQDESSAGSGVAGLPGFDFEAPKNISQERTVVFQRSSLSEVPEKKKKEFAPKNLIQTLLVAVAGGGIFYSLYFDTSAKKPPPKIEPIRPTLPQFTSGRSDPKRSDEEYKAAMPAYLEDTIMGYRTAAAQFRTAAAIDITNVKALAMLASSYLNLIDVSNKDENYFIVINRLIEMSRAKSKDLPETIIADVEFYLTANKPEAAQNRIVEYSKTHPDYGQMMFYYISQAFYARGDFTQAAKYISQIPDNKAFSAKVFYLRGQIAEALKDADTALREYQKAVKLNPKHAKSMLRIAQIYRDQSKSKDGREYLSYILDHKELITPQDLGLAYYLHAQLNELEKKTSDALLDIERAVKLDPDKHEYLFELYTLRAATGQADPEAKKQAAMYGLLGQGEKLVLDGKYQEALVIFLQARQANDESYLPLLKIGDLFKYLNNVENQKMNYRIATEKAPTNVQVWSKYIHSLIESYDWEEAKKAMEKFSKLPVNPSTVDKLMADFYQKQGNFAQAQVYYKKAMSRNTIDTEVYMDYAKSLMSTRNFKDAPFFFALGLRFDPLNIEAILNTARCVSETESIDKGIEVLQDELQKQSFARAEFLAGIAELYIKKGSWEAAQKSVDQAMLADPNYAYAWKLQAQIHMSKENVDKNALDLALAAYKSYSDRNTSDPSGYLERFKLYMKKLEFDNAKGELVKIFEAYPKYPNLYYYRGTFYAAQGNHQKAAQEFEIELKNNPDNLQVINDYGKELLELGQHQKALDYFTKAMQIAPKSAEAKQNAAWASYHLKNFQAAVALFNSALQIEKSSPTIYKRLGIVYRDMGDVNAACGSFRKYLEMEPDAPDKGEFGYCNR